MKTVIVLDVRANQDALRTAARDLGRAFTVRELHEAARHRRAALGLTTAYRAVERWRRQGVAEQAGVRDGEALFVLCEHGGHHHHVVCVACGAEIVLDPCPLGDLRQAVEAAGFRLEDDALGAIPGRCGQCWS